MNNNKLKKWKYSRINQEIMMTRIVKFIEIRPINKLEKILLPILSRKNYL